ncbi:MAG: PAS domain-containing protein [Gemmatimonadetes bacterium]|nr:PAS domain-containing protein [Gemmatimonadota bacterium]NIR81489.1 PAS domain-containing protein [Gemmatimonadota bacterium]NIT90336.1 PAS domain-containing protein [Gemmatimonadota bacterium]NIU34161.1 PAS domain-containing protein [Gemmatimonadota bacterium]NIU38312.1 PAS domain-containing protein [Gemmatimonadota bacterium]
MSVLTLDSHDRRLLSRALEALLSPLAHESLDGWRAAVNRSLKRLLGADMVGFDFPVPGEARVYSEEHDPERAKDYHEVIRPLDSRFQAFRRFQRLGVGTREMGWGPHLDEMLESAYYNEYIVPMRCFDTLAAHGRDGRSGIAYALYFHHERETGPKFGERGLGLLRLLYPAFRTGVGTYLRMVGRRERLAALIDGLDRPAALFDREGRILHRNPAFARIAGRTSGRSLMEEAEALARDLVVAREDGSPEQSGGPESRVVPSRRGPLRLRASLLDSSSADGARILIVGDDPTVVLPTEGWLGKRFDLTPRQAEVALLLARRRTNAEIAEALGISPHTARRHTEKVLLKLGISSRRDVRRVITGGP